MAGCDLCVGVGRGVAGGSGVGPCVCGEVEVSTDAEGREAEKLGGLFQEAFVSQCLWKVQQALCPRPSCLPPRGLSSRRTGTYALKFCQASPSSPQP